MPTFLPALLTAISLLAIVPAAHAEISRIWLTHRSHDPSKIVVNWQTSQPGNSTVEFAASAAPLATVMIDESVVLHHVEIPLARKDTTYRYRVRTGGEQSAEATFKAYPTETLRAAVVADWQAKPKLDAILRDDVHLLLTAGDNIGNLFGPCGAGVKDCVQPYAALIDAYPQLFRSTPFMPVLGNHDREIRPRGNQPPPEPVYDVEATAFCEFFALPGDEWRWYFDVPDFDLRLIGLDLNHLSDLGTTWQTCHPCGPRSEQFQWYEKLMAGPQPARVVTLYNERNSQVRSRDKSAWSKPLGRGTMAISGFGYFAERAEADGTTYYNTALGTGAKYPDPRSQFFASTPSYMLLTITAGQMVVEIKSLDGKTLDRKPFSAAQQAAR